MADFFISYRTADEPITAVLIKHVLGNRFGAGRVFLDNTSIPLGVHFPPVIDDALADCRVLIAVIGARWFEVDAQGCRRVDDPADWVRREIISALGRGIPVIPVFVGDVKLAATDLPPELAALPARQFLSIRLRAVEHDLEPLIDRLSSVIEPDQAGPDQAGPDQIGPEDEADQPAGSGVHITFRKRVQAPCGVFGIQNSYRR